MVKVRAQDGQGNGFITLIAGIIEWAHRYIGIRGLGLDGHTAIEPGVAAAVGCRAAHFVVNEQGRGEDTLPRHSEHTIVSTLFGGIVVKGSDGHRRQIIVSDISGSLVVPPDSVPAVLQQTQFHGLARFVDIIVNRNNINENSGDTVRDDDLSGEAFIVLSIACGTAETVGDGNGSRGVAGRSVNLHLSSNRAGFGANPLADDGFHIDCGTIVVGNGNGSGGIGTQVVLGTGQKGQDNRGRPFVDGILNGLHRDAGGSGPHRERHAARQGCVMPVGNSSSADAVADRERLGRHLGSIDRELTGTSAFHGNRGACFDPHCWRPGFIDGDGSGTGRPHDIKRTVLQGDHHALGVVRNAVIDGQYQHAH